jgi:hypothetical protein
LDELWGLCIDASLFEGEQGAGIGEYTEANCWNHRVMPLAKTILRTLEGDKYNSRLSKSGLKGKKDGESTGYAPQQFAGDSPP